MLHRSFESHKSSPRITLYCNFPFHNKKSPINLEIAQLSTENLGYVSPWYMVRSVAPLHNGSMRYRFYYHNGTRLYTENFNAYSKFGMCPRKYWTNRVGWVNGPKSRLYFLRKQSPLKIYEKIIKMERKTTKFPSREWKGGFRTCPSNQKDGRRAERVINQREHSFLFGKTRDGENSRKIAMGWAGQMSKLKFRRVRKSFGVWLMTVTRGNRLNGGKFFFALVNPQVRAKICRRSFI